MERRRVTGPRYGASLTWGSAARTGCPRRFAWPAWPTWTTAFSSWTGNDCSTALTHSVFAAGLVEWSLCCSAVSMWTTCTRPWLTRWTTATPTPTPTSSPARSGGGDDDTIKWILSWLAFSVTCGAMMSTRRLLSSDRPLALLLTPGLGQTSWLHIRSELRWLPLCRIRLQVMVMVSIEIEINI